jgi:hypothetical protein
MVFRLVAHCLNQLRHRMPHIFQWYMLLIFYVLSFLGLTKDLAWLEIQASY